MLLILDPTDQTFESQFLHSTTELEMTEEAKKEAKLPTPRFGVGDKVDVPGHGLQEVVTVLPHATDPRYLFQIGDYSNDRKTRPQDVWMHESAIVVPLPAEPLAEPAPEAAGGTP